MKFQIEVIKSKIHRVTVTQADLHYVGSITIDEALLEAANIIEGEKVQIMDIDNGERFETYVIKGERGSGCICLNGAAARKVQVGDVIIRLTSPYTAVLIDEASAGMVVSSNFVIIRVDRSRLLPGYLVWLINTPKIRKAIYENTSSNMLGAINARFFSEFEIPPLSILQQQKIAELHLLAKKETALLRQLSAEKDRYYDLLIRNVHSIMK